MLLSLTEEIKQRFVIHVQNQYGHTLHQLVVEQPPKTEMGDLAFPFCFELAKVVRKAPRQVATEIANSIGEIEGVAKVQVAGPGYINVFFQRDTFFKQLFLARGAAGKPTSSGKDHPRAHQHQSQQGGSYWTFAQRGARRHIRATAAFQRAPG